MELLEGVLSNSPLSFVTSKNQVNVWDRDLVSYAYDNYWDILCFELIFLFLRKTVVFRAEKGLNL